MNNIARYEDTELRCFDRTLYRSINDLERESSAKVIALLEGLTPEEKLDRLNEYETES